MTRVRRTRAFLCLAGVLLASTVVAGAPATAEAPAALKSVEAERETPARFDDEAGGDADADDPAVWVHPERSADSVVLGTLKNGGLEAYDLDGELLQHVDTPPPPGEGLEAGRFNNVDLLQDADVEGLPSDFAVVTDRGRDRLRVYEIAASGADAGDAVLTDITDPDAPRLFSATEEEVEEQATGYGLALFTDDAGEAWAAVSRRHRTAIGLFRLVPAANGTVSYEAAGRVRLPSGFDLPGGGTWTPCEDPGEGPQVEGMVVDARVDVLYAAQEDVGVWRIPVNGDDFGRPRLVERVREYGIPAVFDEGTEECVPAGPDPGVGGEHLSADAEGLTIAYRDNGRARLVASSQGDSTFSIYRLPTAHVALPWLQSFDVIDSDATDGVQHSDGGSVVTGRVGADFPHGLLVLHDGENTPVVEDGAGEPRPNTNFKYLRWDRVHG